MQREILKLDENIEISDSRRIIDLRNWVIHGYDKVEIISRDLPNLKKQVDKLIGK